MESSMESPGWSALPLELWELVAKKLHLPDLYSFAAVCTTWRCLMQGIRPYKFPWLVLSDIDANRTKPNTHPFFNLLEGKVCGLPVPKLRGKRCCGSSHGWLITASECSNSFHLLNPFSRVEIPLPPPSAFPHPQYPRNPAHPRDWYFIHKAILSSDPATSSHYTVMAIYSDQSWLAFFKSGTDKWVHINTLNLAFVDLVYYTGRFYAQTNDGIVVVCNLDEGDHPKTIEIITPSLYAYRKARRMPIRKGPCSEIYLAESSGELLQVWRMVSYHRDSCDPKNPTYCTTVGVKVFKIDHQARNMQGEGGRVEVTSLGSDRVFFLGNCSSISVSVQHFQNLKGNRIFFEDERHCVYDKRNFVVYDLDDESIRPFLPPGLTHCNFLPPIWILPNPQ